MDYRFTAILILLFIGLTMFANQQHQIVGEMIDMNTGEVRMVASDAIGIAAERNVNINSGQRLQFLRSNSWD